MLSLEPLESRTLLSNDLFVRGLYVDVLERPGAPAEVASWTPELVANGRASVVNGFWTSTEHRGDQVNDYYEQFLHRTPSSAERQSWVNDFANGATEAEIAVGFLSSAEYLSKNPVPTAFVEALYNDVLRRPADPGGLNFWVNYLGQTNPQRVAEGIVGSLEHYQKSVVADYQDYLHRTPSASEIAPWTQSLVEGQSSFGSVARSILGSNEYVAPIVTRNVVDQATLTAAINEFNGAGTFNTISLLDNISLTSALPTITGAKPLTLDGNAGLTLKRDAAAEFRVLHSQCPNFTVQNITIANGSTTDNGGGIFNDGNNRLTILHSTITNNTSNLGGGVFNQNGTLVIKNSIISHNLSQTFGGGVRSSLDSSTTARIELVENSTFLDNTAVSSGGGGICNYFGSSVGQIINCTFTGNHGQHGAGICNHTTIDLIANCTLTGNTSVISGGGIENDNTILNLVSTIVAGNQQGTGGDLYPNQPLNSSNNLIGGNPLLGALANNGGPTPTMLPLAGSPALNAGSNPLELAYDQRGAGFPRTHGSVTDIGAVEG